MSRCNKCRKANLKWIEVADGGHLKWILVDRRTRTKHVCPNAESKSPSPPAEKNTEESERLIPWWQRD